MVKRCHEEKVEAIVQSPPSSTCLHLVVEADVDTSGQSRIKLNLLVALGLAFCIQQTDLAFFAFPEYLEYGRGGQCLETGK